MAALSMLPAGLDAKTWKGLEAGLYKALTRRLTVLHTNDIHSHIDPFEGGRNDGHGGLARLAGLVKNIRATEEHVLLLDAGDYFSGTPYFNLFKGEPEFELMNAMGYDAVTIGNHEFDASIPDFADRAREARFPILAANYDFSSTAVKGLTKDYTILKRGGIKVGIYGIGINLRYWTRIEVAERIGFANPIETALRVEEELARKGCELIICLSHLGYNTSGLAGEFNDMDLAQKTKRTHLIIGGHTHTFMDAPKSMQNAAGQQVWVNQVGFGGLRLGRLTFTFTPEGKNRSASVEHVL